MKLFHKFSLFAVASLLLAGCNSENELPGTPPDDGGKTDANTREVQLILKNKLNLKPAGTKAPIATEAENTVSSLDVYVFASDTEDGTYTFQELFYYRDDPSQTIAQSWAHSFELTTADNTSGGLLRLTKGLYVKLLCIANQTKLYATAADGTVTEYTDFAPLNQTAPGQITNVVTPGRPTLADFEALHTPLINPETAADTIATPLPMAGAVSTAIDLTGMAMTAKLQSSVMLNRMVARFDVINDSEKSKFKLTEIVMVNGRKGCTYFPVRPIGATPAAADDLIRYPARTVTAAQQGSKDNELINSYTTRVPGAFYIYPSPKEDAGYLLLKGTYYPNKTEQREVSYPIYFEPVGGLGNYIEVAANHRYTVTITDAGDSQLDFTMNVLPWEEGDEVDQYEPDNGFSDDPVELITEGAYPATGAQVLADGTVSALAIDGTQFAFHVGSNAPIEEKLIYEGDPWLVIDPVPRAVEVTRASLDTVFAYKTVAADELALFTHIQPVTIRLTNLASGKKKEIRVVPVPGPEVAVSAADAADNLNKYDAATRTLTLYNVANSAKVLTVTAATADGSTGSRVEATGCDWLTVTPNSLAGASGDYTLTLAAAQEPLPGAGKLKFVATATGAETIVNVALKDPSASVVPGSFDNKGNENNSYAQATSTVTLEGTAANGFSIRVSSPEGVTPSVTGGADWLAVTSEETAVSDGKVIVTLTASIVEGADVSAGKADGAITFANKIPGGADQVINVVVPESSPVTPP